MRTVTTNVEGNNNDKKGKKRTETVCVIRVDVFFYYNIILHSQTPNTRTTHLLFFGYCYIRYDNANERFIIVFVVVVVP